MKCFSGKSLSPECLESILQTLAEGLFIVNREEVIQYCNKALLEMTGRNESEILDQKCCSLVKDTCNPLLNVHCSQMEY